MNVFKNPIFITVMIILLGGAGLFYGLTKLGAAPTVSAEVKPHYKGSESAKVTLTEYSDLQCPACKNFNDTVKPELITRYGDNLKVEFRHFPLTSIHRNAQRAAEATEAAAAQGKFWEYHDILFARQTSEALEWNTNKLTEYAKELGLDTERFKKELQDDLYREGVQKMEQDAKDKGFTGTPTILINGEKVDNPTVENLQKKIDEILGGQNLASGTPTTTPAAQ